MNSKARSGSSLMKPWARGFRNPMTAPANKSPAAVGQTFLPEVVHGIPPILNRIGAKNLDHGRVDLPFQLICLVVEIVARRGDVEFFQIIDATL
jgi:hypothetical protein